MCDYAIRQVYLRSLSGDRCLLLVQLVMGVLMLVQCSMYNGSRLLVHILAVGMLVCVGGNVLHMWL